MRRVALFLSSCVVTAAYAVLNSWSNFLVYSVDAQDDHPLAIRFFSTKSIVLDIWQVRLLTSHNQRTQAVTQNDAHADTHTHTLSLSLSLGEKSEHTPRSVILVIQESKNKGRKRHATETKTCQMGYFLGFLTHRQHTAPSMQSDTPARLTTSARRGTHLLSFEQEEAVRQNRIKKIG